MGGPLGRKCVVRPASLDAARVDGYLARLGSPQVTHDADGLAALQRAHLLAVPFHNLLLLANDGRDQPLAPLERVVDDAIAGIGGNCDRTTPPFTALLRSLGFDAWLSAATVSEPGDHFVCVVESGGVRYLCDVGNGHPYMRPWELDGATQEQCFFGWRFRFEPRGDAGPTLSRHLGGDDWKTVYVVDPTPRRYHEFEPIVRAHYSQVGFGPFLSGLRAVRILPDAIFTLRDREYVRHTRIGRCARPVFGREAFGALLIGRFGLPQGLVADALSVLERRRPDLVADTPRWLDLGRGRVEERATVEPPTHEEVPDVLVALATVGRRASVQRLLDTLAEEARASAYPGRVGVLIIDNHESALPPDDVPDGLAVHRVPISEVLPALERAATCGVLPRLHERLPVPIGAAREAQLAALRTHFAHPIPELPHPASRPTVVWMIDDDLAFEQLVENAGLGRHTHLLCRVARYWCTLPQRSVVLGTFTGDPPVPGLDSLGGQLDDLAAAVERLCADGPDHPWDPPTPPLPQTDAYYDLTEASQPRSPEPWPYAPEMAGRPAAEVARSLLGDLRRLLDGEQLTRPLVWDGEDAPSRASLRRGGNTLYLDLDALFRWPTPVLASSDGVLSRRADTLWAALAQAEDPDGVAEMTLPLHHGRSGQAGRDAKPVDCHELAVNAAAQVRGFVLARALSEGRDIASELPARESRVAGHRARLRQQIADLGVALAGLRAWGVPAVDAELADASKVLAALDHHAACSAPLPGRADEIRAFLDRLPGAVQAWRESW
ncbi:MAG: arylamine N-acetyltransferase [Myxococcota bacterium]